MTTFTFTDPGLDKLDPEERRFLAHVWQTASIAISAADASTQDTVARQVAAGAVMAGEVLPDRQTIVVRIGDVEVLRTSAATLARQVLARKNPELN